MGRPPCCDKSTVKRGLWTAEEDAKLLAYTTTHGTGNWTSVPRKAGLKRCGKSCRLRWTNYLRPNLKLDSFTPEEEVQIVNLHAKIGSRWSIIAKKLPGRTDNDVKNYWNTKLSKKLYQKGIDPITHRPISEVIQSIEHLRNNTVAGSTTASSTFHFAPVAATAGAGAPYHDRGFKASSFSRPELTINSASGSSSTPASLDLFPLDAEKGPVPTMIYFSPTEASCSSTAATAPKTSSPPSDFLWTDFLVESLQSSEGDSNFTCTTNTFLTGNNNFALDQNEHGLSRGYKYYVDEETSDCAGAPACSFVDDILEQDRELVSTFYQYISDPSELP